MINKNIIKFIPHSTINTSLNNVYIESDGTILTFTATDSIKLAHVKLTEKQSALLIDKGLREGLYQRQGFKLFLQEVNKAKPDIKKAIDTLNIYKSNDVDYPQYKELFKKITTNTYTKGITKEYATDHLTAFLEMVGNRVDFTHINEDFTTKAGFTYFQDEHITLLLMPILK